MYKVKVNGEKDFEIVNNIINGQDLAFDMIEVKEGEFHVLLNNKSYTAIITNMSPEEKKDFSIRGKEKLEIRHNMPKNIVDSVLYTVSEHL